MDTNGCDMPNKTDFALVLDSGGVLGPHEGKMRNRRFCSYGNFGDKITVFTCLPGTEGCGSFPRHLDLTLAPNKQMKGLRSNETPSIRINRGTLSLV